MSLRNGILGLLCHGPMTGYSLKKEFDRSINHMWTASLSQIYRELDTMKKKEYITFSIERQEDKPDKKIYTITEKGRGAFLEWLADFPENLSSTKRDEFMLRVFFGADLENGVLIEQFSKFINQKEQYIELLNGLVTSVEEESADIPQKDLLFWKFTVKRALMTLETLIIWAKECIVELNRFEESEK